MSDQASSSQTGATGPIVVHFSTPSDDSKGIMNTVTLNNNRKKRRRNRIFSLVIGIATLAVIVFVAQENFFQFQNASPPRMSETLVKNGPPQPHKKPGSNNNFDVNAPPNPSMANDPDYEDKKSFLFWGQQAIRLKEMNEHDVPGTKKKVARNKQGKKNKLVPIPVIDADDDNLPHTADGSNFRAADILLCGKIVIDYVVNATDLKDECDGLKKAFTKTCTNEEVVVESSSSNSKNHMRRLLVDQDHPRHSRKQGNPLIAWQHFFYRLMHRLWHWLEPKEVVFMSEEEVVEEFELAMFEVKLGFDIEVSDDDDALRRSHRRFLEENIKGKAVFERAHNKTASKDKHMMYLQLPTTNKHVSAKTWSETLVLQNEERMIESVMKAQQNQTNVTVKEAVANAAASSKAVADTAAFVSNILNDPTSVEARACCTSILNVFHENCSVDEEEELSDSRLFISVAVIGLCGLVKTLIRHFRIRWLPEAAGCILVGVFVGWVIGFYPHHDLSFDGNWFLRIMVPPIVFEAALSIDKRSFNRHVVPIIIYAVAGTLIATCLTAVVVHKGSEYFLCETIPFIEALLFGALISSIDPIAVLSVLSNMGMTDTDTIYVVIFGESLLNDGVAIVLFQTLVHFLDENMTVDSQALVAAAIHFLVVALGSVLVGVGSGMLCTVYYWMMHGCQTALVEVLIFFCWALLPYYVCDGVEWSGVVAVVTTGFVMDLTVVGQQRYDDPQEASERQQSPASPRERRRRKVFSREGHLSVEAKTHVGFVAEVVATMMETAIFAYLGLFLINSRYHWSIFHTFIAIGGCCLSRAIMIPTLSFFANWITRIQQFEARWRYNKLPQHSQEERTALHGPNIPAGVIIDKNMQLVLWFAGLRGAMSFALVENIPLYDATTGEGTRVKSELKAMTSACIIFTVFFLGGSTYYMMDLLGLAPTNPNDHPNVTAVEKETEMIGLLSKHSRDEDDEITHDDNGTTEKFHLDAKNRTTFRHRINADKESTD